MLFNKGASGGGISYTTFKKEATNIPGVNTRYVWDAIIGQDEVVVFKPKVFRDAHGNEIPNPEKEDPLK